MVDRPFQVVDEGKNGLDQVFIPELEVVLYSPLLPSS